MSERILDTVRSPTPTAGGERAMRRLTPLAVAGRPRPVSVDAQVQVNRACADRYRHLRLYAPRIATRARPGQFVMITTARDGESGPVLPRPMAIYTRDATTGVVDIVYAVVGDGTRALATFVSGEHLTVTGPLGQGFVVPHCIERVLLLGRGIGSCSLTTVAQDLAGSRTEMLAVLSARTPAAVIGAEVFRRSGARAVWPIDDADGSSDMARLRERLRRAYGDRPPQQILTCGSERLARLSAQLADPWEASVQVSVEAHMACGLGYCHGCAAEPVDGPAGRREPPLVCRDGPVFALSTADGGRVHDTLSAV